MTSAPERLTEALAGRYRVERELGQGGMAVVYLAEDLKHRRKVALKVLKPELAAVIGADRFLVEITTTANLQHPHILPLHDSGTVDGTVFYVMPLVEGESLRDRITREKQLPVNDAIRIAREVADALDYAHRHHVVHRDIKPENILLHDGRAVVADFGIALAVSRTEGSARMTETGMSLGTPHYMSPEQAMGERDLDGRADVYALGCVLHEMLAGEPPFTGPTAQAIIAKVMGGEPATLTSLRRSVPEHVEEAVLTALEKIPADRFATAGAFGAALTGSAESGAIRSREVKTGKRARRLQRVVWPAIAALLALVALGGWLRPRSPASSPLPPTQLALLLPDLIGSRAALQRTIELSPDGTSLLYASLSEEKGATKRVWLDGSGSQVMEGVAPFVADYVMSPDGRSFLASSYTTGAIFRYGTGGSGTAKPLPRGVLWKQRGAWAGNGNIWLSDVSNLEGGIIRITASDSVTRPFGKRHSDLGMVQILPGDRLALAIRAPNGTTTGPAVILDLESGEGRVVLDEAIVELRYGAGHLVYVLGDGTLHAVPFNERKGTLAGAPVTLARGVALTGTGLAQLAMAANGTVAFVVEEGQSLVMADRLGAGRPVVPEMRNYHHPRFSPDGRRIAIDFNSDDGRDVWILNLADSAMTRATIDRDGHDASWSPDGRTIAYTSFRGGVFGLHSLRPGGSDPGDSLLTLPNLAYTGIWLRDGSGLLTVGQTLRPESGTDIGIVRNGGRGPVVPLVATRFAEQYPALSRDNEWIAFTSNQSGRDEVYARALTGGDVIQVSLNGGGEPVWSHDGRELFYRGLPNAGTGTEAMIMSAKISTRPAFRVMSREVLFSASAILTANPHTNYDVSPDGKRFVYVRSNPSSRVMVIQNLPAMVAKLRSGGQAAP